MAEEPEAYVDAEAAAELARLRRIRSENLPRVDIDERDAVEEAKGEKLARYWLDHIPKRLVGEHGMSLNTVRVAGRRVYEIAAEEGF